MRGERIVEAGVTRPTALSDDPSIDSTLREAAATSLISYPGRFSGSERFELVRLLGEGAFGVVYETIDHAQGGLVALKVLRRPYAELLYRFKREFRALTELRHPNLVRLHELIALGPDVFFTMELIDGQPLLQHVASQPEQAREVLRQLAEGLTALHRAGKLHCDVKPPNILMEKSGRLVLLDFGLAVEIDARESADMAGTPLYMSPEQCAQEPLGAASDWYAAGVVLFEALTGHTPFDGTVIQVLRAKQDGEAPRASSLVAGIPADLDDLCAALLSRDPKKRPTGEEVLRLLRAAPPPAPARAELFVGRGAELAQLWRSFDKAAEGQAQVALARGPSGIGKSALLRRFLDEVRRRRPDAMILDGRCYELESVPYKALDAVIDELARQLKRLPDVEAAALLPREAHALTKLFPVLRQVPAFSQLGAVRADGRSGDGADAAEVRARGLAALRELFARLADRRPVVVCVDDLQWGDVDSAALLAELVRTPDAPAVFWLASFREEEVTTSPMLRRLTQLRETTLADVRIREVRLAGLGGAEARELAATLLTETRGDEARAQAIAQESGGSPFFVHELSRLGGGDHALGELVRRRVAQLEGAARQILEVVAVGSRPLELNVVADAAQVSDELRDALAILRAERLLRARESESEKLVECYHDRIREAVVRAIAPEPLRAIHRRLAAALERHGCADAAQIGRHLADGGDPARAQGYLVRAAEGAASALAFDEATQLYQRALELSPLVDGGGDPLPIELAHAESLSAAGHGPEAARLWLALVDRVEPVKRIDLRRRAAEELLISGRLDDGYAAISGVLAELGLSMPRSTAAAVASVVVSRARQVFAGHELRARSEPASERELQRIDTLAGLAWAVWMLDPIIGAALHAQAKRLVLRSGDRARAAVILSLEAPMTAVRGVQARERTRAVLTAARQLAAGLDDSQMPAAVFSAVEATVALLEGRWMDALRHVAEAEQIVHPVALGHGSLRASIYSLKAMSMFWVGRSGDSLRILPPLIREMEERGNLNGWIWLKLLEGWAQSCCGRTDLGRTLSAQVRERMPERGFQLQRWYLELGQVQFLLFEGKAEEAWRWSEELSRRTRFALVGQSMRVSALWVRANAALARAMETPSARAAMLSQSRRLARRLEQEHAPWVDAVARSVRAGIASVGGDRDAAIRLLAEAEPLLETHHLESVLTAARLARGRLVGGETGRALVARSEAWMAEQRMSPGCARGLLPGDWEGGK